MVRPTKAVFPTLWKWSFVFAQWIFLFANSTQYIFDFYIKLLKEKWKSLSVITINTEL